MRTWRTLLYTLVLLGLFAFNKPLPKDGILAAGFVVFIILDLLDVKEITND